MAKSKKVLKPEPESQTERRVLLVATEKHPYKIAGKTRTAHGRKAKRLIESGWFKLAK